MKKFLMIVSLAFGIQSISMAGCDDCGTIGVGGSIGGLSDGPTIGGGSGDDGVGVRHHAVVRYFRNGVPTFVDITGFRHQCQQLVDLYMNNPNAGASIIKHCTPFGQ